MDLVVAALVRADRPRRSDIGFLGVQRVVGTLAVHPADRVDRRQVRHVETHVGDPVQFRHRGGERAVHRAARLVETAGRAREELVPGTERGPLAVHPQPHLLALGDQFADRMVVHDPRHHGGQRRCHAFGQRTRVVPQDGRGTGQQSPVEPPVRPAGHPVQQPGAQFDVVRQVARPLTGLDLDLDRVPERGPRVAPGIDPVGPRARLVRHDHRGEQVDASALFGHSGLPRDPVMRPAPCDGRGDPVVSVPPHRGRHRQVLAYHGLRRPAAAADRGDDVVDTESAGHGQLPPPRCPRWRPVCLK